jgi:hypothetical protein
MAFQSERLARWFGMKTRHGSNGKQLDDNTEVKMKQPRRFDFPASLAFREGPNKRKRRPLVPLIGRHSDEQELIDYVADLEAENHSLRLALDVARMATGKRQEARKTDRRGPGFQGIQE